MLENFVAECVPETDYIDRKFKNLSLGHEHEIDPRALLVDLKLEIL